MKYIIYTLILSFAFSNATWAQFGKGTDGQADLVIEDEGTDKPAPVKKQPVKNKPVKKAPSTPLQGTVPPKNQDSPILSHQNFQIFEFNASGQAGMYGTSIPFSMANDFGVFEQFVTSNPLVLKRDVSSVTKGEGKSIIWIYQEQPINDLSGRSSTANERAFGIDFIKPEWADAFVSAAENNSVAFFLIQPQQLGEVIAMHQVVVVETKKREVFFLPSLMALVNDSYKEAGMPYAPGKKLVDAFYKHIIELTDDFNDTDICDMFSDSDYDVNKNIDGQPENIKNIGQIFPKTYSIFSEASDYVYNNNYFFGDENGIISRVDQACNLDTLWNEFFYYILINGVTNKKPTLNQQAPLLGR